MADTQPGSPRCSAPSSSRCGLDWRNRRRASGLRCQQRDCISPPPSGLLYRLAEKGANTRHWQASWVTATARGLRPERGWNWTFLCRTKLGKTTYSVPRPPCPILEFSYYPGLIPILEALTVWLLAVANPWGYQRPFQIMGSQKDN